MELKHIKRQGIFKFICNHYKDHFIVEIAKGNGFKVISVLHHFNFRDENKVGVMEVLIQNVGEEELLKSFANNLTHNVPIFLEESTRKIIKANCFQGPKLESNYFNLFF